MGLVDQYDLLVYPNALGKGLPIFFWPRRAEASQAGEFEGFSLRFGSSDLSAEVNTSEERATRQILGAK